jgi:cytochrome c oxidase subunit 4
MSSHHIISLKYLFGTAFALLILTGLTVAVAYIHIPAPFNIIVAIGIAVLKASLVAAFFMGLYWDKKINTIALLLSVVFFTLMVGITLLDTLYRDKPSDIFNKPPKPPVTQSSLQ